jgi:predicted dinucleotide-binding enzyme
VERWLEGAISGAPSVASIVVMSTRIGVIGSGPVGRGIATLLQRAGDDVLLATRRTQAPELRELPAAVAIGSAQDAAARGVVVLAILHSAARELLAKLEPSLGGKIVIDTMNPWLPRAREVAGMRSGETEGTWLARRLPRSHVVRAFSHIDWDLLVPGATGEWAAGYAADDRAVSATAEALIARMGYTPVRVGDLAGSAALDPGGRFFGRMLTPADMLAAVG